MWKMNWCKAKGLAPAQTVPWNMAEEAYQLMLSSK